MLSNNMEPMFLDCYKLNENQVNTFLILNNFVRWQETKLWKAMSKLLKLSPEITFSLFHDIYLGNIPDEDDEMQVLIDNCKSLIRHDKRSRKILKSAGITLKMLDQGEKLIAEIYESMESEGTGFTN
ncbi:MAG: hypothetical protein JXR95_08505 [Deltaproteobacteria bacterium]|nr:hypothetical protein [Deltaproteobacteria bacterium]